MKCGLLLVRADATVNSGTGHAMRCLALAQAWQHRGGDVMFAMSQSTPAIAERLRSEKIGHISIDAASGTVDDLKQTVASVALHNAEWAVVDGYHFDRNYVSGLQNACPVLLVDDNAELKFYSARFVLNQNLYATSEMYSKRSPDTRLLLGQSYALLRQEFTAYRNWFRTVSERGRRILITMGGSDPRNLTPGIVAALAELPFDDLPTDLKIRVVVGGSAENRSTVAEVAARFPERVELRSNVTNMAVLMAWADMAIAGAGTTCWEMCLLGLPAVLIVVAENQHGIAQHVTNIGAAVSAGSADSLDYSSLARTSAELLENREQRFNMSRAARNLVDGLGSQRVCAALQDRELNLRMAQQSDCRLLFDWASDARARAASFRSSVISWEEHTLWFAERLQDKQSVMFIGENAASEPVGLVRFQLRDRTAVVSVNVAPEFRGQGWGGELISFSIASLTRSFSVQRIDAFVKPSNQASIQLFESSGFHLVGAEQISGQNALHFVLEVGSEINVS
jgi:UDP-2,4-diacetamido-2,4,6-trideoxy-beta-L-altropyranose hydrolase